MSQKGSSFLVFILCFFPLFPAFGQQPSSGVTITPHRAGLQSITSSDYWVAFPENYGGTNDGGKYIKLFVSSVDSTTAYIALGGDTLTLDIIPGKTLALDVPLSWEMLETDTVESKAIHVWSNDAPLFVDFNSHDAYTSDASYVIPSAGWGHTYVIASYASLQETAVFDLPSEFVIVSNQDSTVVTITPSTALRKVTGSAVYPAGIPFTVTMNQGQAVQYEVVRWDGTSSSMFDATGTVITASNPVGVVGASSCASIPIEFPYCDFVCEMIPPIRTWGMTYYTAPLYGRVGGDMFLLVASQPNQRFTRTDDIGMYSYSDSTDANYSWVEGVASASKWTSAAPFLLMQYSNSSTWPAGTNGLYDPFMMAVNSVEQFSTPVIFNVLRGATDQSPYFWHADIVARSGIPVYINGNPLSSTPIYDDQSYAVYRLDSLNTTQYIASSDSGVSVSVYGDGFDEAVGYSGMIGVSSIKSLDNTAPQVHAVLLSAASTHFTVSDSSANMSGLSEFEVDSLSNMKLLQSPTFVDGNGSATGSFDLVVIDSTNPAHAMVRVLDLAGNYTTVVRDYIPGAAAVIGSAPTVPSAIVEPNPVRGFVTINYSLQNEGPVTINLYDILGTRQLCVEDKNEMAGDHSVTADVRLLPAGTYICRIESNGKTESSRISIVK